MPEAAAKGLSSIAPEILGATTILGLHLLTPREIEKPKRETRAMPFTAEIIQPIVSPAAATKAKVKQTPLLKEILSATQVLKTIHMAPQILKPPKLITKLPRKREEPFLRIKRADIFGKKPKRKWAGYLYPVLPEEKLPAYMKIGLGKATKLKSATSFIFSKKK
jgi:hypothetical protein